jgi:GT2 family glycosyltransferase
MNKYTTTIIITTWNSLEYLKLCLRAIKKYTNSPYRIIIFDNGSNDGTKEYFYSNGYRNFIYLRNKTNLGTIKALKIAENYVKTKFVVLLDSDSIVSPNWLKTFIKIYKNNPKIKAIGPIKPSTQLSYPYRNDKNSREIWEEIKLKFYRLSPEKLLKKYCKDKSYETFVNDFLKANNGRDIILKCPPEILSGCCTFLDYNFIKRIGGLTNSVFEKYGVDDADRCWRIAKAGGLVVKTRKVYVHHFEGSSLKKTN